MDTFAWLLEADPAIRFQALRDLTATPVEQLAAERALVASGGAAARILAAQGVDGAWHREGEPDWLPTLFMLQWLRATQVEATHVAVLAAMERLCEGFRWHEEFGARPFFEGEVEPCINGGTLALGAYFGHPSEQLAQRLLGEQLSDGGWNCEAPKSSRSSFHTTICVLEGLLEYERAVGGAPELAAARRRGEGYLLERSLFRRLSTGEVAHPAFLEFAFPPRYHHDVLRALDYFRASVDEPDPRLAEALQHVENKRTPEGRWLLERAQDEALSIPFDERLGEPSRWNTLRALRVLRWAGMPYQAPGP